MTTLPHEVELLIATHIWPALGRARVVSKCDLAEIGSLIEIRGVESSDVWCGFVEGVQPRFGSFRRESVELLDHEEPASRLPTHRRLGSHHEAGKPGRPPPPTRPPDSGSSPLPDRDPKISERVASSAPSLPNRNGLHGSKSASHHLPVPALPSRTVSVPAVPVPSLPSKHLPAPSLPTRNVLEDIVSILPAVEKVRTAEVCEEPFEPGLGDVDFESFDFMEVDDIARSIPPKFASSITTMATYLTEHVRKSPQIVSSLPEPAASIVPLLRAVFFWITDNISYDINILTNPAARAPQSADAVLNSKSAVCEGYANLFVSICRAAGLGKDVVQKVVGYAKGVGFSPGQVSIERDSQGQPTNHAWIVAWLNGRPYFVEATWGSGYAGPSQSGYVFEKRFEPHYFLMDPRRTIYTHFPASSKQQYIFPELSEDEFLDLPTVKPAFFRHKTVVSAGHKIISGSLIEIPENGDGFVKLRVRTSSTPHVRGSMTYPVQRDRRTGNPIEGSGRVHENGIFVLYEVLESDRDWMVTLLFRLPGRGEAVVNWFIKTSAGAEFPQGTMAGSFLVRQVSDRQQVPFPQSLGDSGLMLVEPLDGVLQIGRRYRFLLRDYESSSRLPPKKKLVLIPMPSPGVLDPWKMISFDEKPNKERTLREYLVETIISEGGDWIVGMEREIGWGQKSYDFVAKFHAE
ncbi:hypothetical protein HDU93_009752 [Gonapodya sp. JEL0774]|nr:hypothetical protein HDU93_009752 [Gonapodya sp. JEL0774]